MWLEPVKCKAAGRSHEVTKTPCQDAVNNKVYISEETKKEIHVVALADGAGSAKYSHYGAEAVTKFVCEEMGKNFEKYYVGFSEEDFDKKAEHKKEFIEKIKKECLEPEIENVRVKENEECGLRDLASTLLAVAVCDNKYIIIHIGDGVIGWIKNDELEVVSKPTNGEFINTTFFTVSDKADSLMKVYIGANNEIKGFVLMSDGPQSALYNRNQNKLVPRLKEIMINSIKNHDNIEKGLKYSFKTTFKKLTSDDCSMIIFMNDECVKDESEKKMPVETKSNQSEIQEEADNKSVDTNSQNKEENKGKRKKINENSDAEMAYNRLELQEKFLKSTENADTFKEEKNKIDSSNEHKIESDHELKRAEGEEFINQDQEKNNTKIIEINDIEKTLKQYKEIFEYLLKYFYKVDRKCFLKVIKKYHKISYEEDGKNRVKITDKIYIRTDKKLKSKIIKIFFKEFKADKLKLEFTKK